jgi:hypothetical protein
MLRVSILPLLLRLLYNILEMFRQCVIFCSCPTVPSQGLDLQRHMS